MAASFTEPAASPNEPSFLKQMKYRLAAFPEGVAFFTMIVVFLFFVFASENFLSGFAISNILTYSSINGVIVVGVVTLMIGGEFDLSVGSTLAVASYVFAILLNDGYSPVIAIAASLAAGAILGAINGWIVIQWHIPSFIATLGTLLAYRGLARFIGGGDFAAYDSDTTPLIMDILNGPIGFLNEVFTPQANYRTVTIWFVIIVVIMSAILLRTRFGNRIYATGGNPGAALAQGINITRVKLYTFILSGFFAGMAGVLQFSQLKSVDPLRGDGLELIVVAAAVIGGARLSGGFGTVTGAAFGAILLGILNQGLVLMGASLQVFRAIAGFMIILAVILSNYVQSES